MNIIKTLTPFKGYAFRIELASKGWFFKRWFFRTKVGVSPGLWSVNEWVGPFLTREKAEKAIKGGIGGWAFMLKSKRRTKK